MSWIDIGAVGDIPLRGARKVITSIGDIALFRTAPDEVFATDDFAAPRGGPLSEGMVHGQSVSCPILNCPFDLTTGMATGEDARVRCYRVRIEGVRVLLDLPSLSENAA